MTIFCDLQKALEAIQHSSSYKENRFLKGIIYGIAKTFQENGHPIVLRWVSGYLGLIGNEKANLAVRNRV